MIIAIDGMGGDYAPLEIVKGCVDASKLVDCEIKIIGETEKIKSELEKYEYDHKKITIKHSTEVISNDDQPVKAIRGKKDSSMVIGFEMLKNNEVDAFISAGSTGALLAGGLFILGRISGIDRPVIAVLYPSVGRPALLVDGGANADCKPKNLLEFGIMGSIYAEKVIGVQKPKIGLVNIGSEPGKGSQTVKSAYELFKKTNLNFYGNLEARKIPSGEVDVIVCDGFVGNVILKLSEGIAHMFMAMLKDSLKDSVMTKIAALILKKSLKKFKNQLDYTEYGGAPLLGVKGAVLKIHGDSDANAVKNAIIKAIPYVENDVVEVIHKEMIEIGEEEQYEK